MDQFYAALWTYFAPPLTHPMQDLVRQTHRETADAVRSAAPGRVDVIDTAVALLNDPAQFFSL